MGGRARDVRAKNFGRNWKFSGSPHLLPTLYLVNASTFYAQMAIFLLLGQTSILLMFYKLTCEHALITPQHGG